MRKLLAFIFLFSLFPATFAQPYRFSSEGDMDPWLSGVQNFGKDTNRWGLFYGRTVNVKTIGGKQVVIDTEAPGDRSTFLLAHGGTNVWEIGNRGGDGNALYVWAKHDTNNPVLKMTQTGDLIAFRTDAGTLSLINTNSYTSQAGVTINWPQYTGATHGTVPMASIRGYKENDLENNRRGALDFGTDDETGSTTIWMTLGSMGHVHGGYKLSPTPSSLQGLNEGTTIAANSTTVQVRGNGGPVTLISTPSISAGVRNGQFLFLSSADGTNTVTLQDNSVLDGTRLKLLADTRTYGFGWTLFKWDATNSLWVEGPIPVPGGGGGGGGEVSSVGISASPSSVFNVSGGPVTSSGTLGISLDPQNPNTFLRGPTFGSQATPSFGAIVDADIPSTFTRDEEWNTIEEFNAALTGDKAATLTGTETLENKTLINPIIASFANGQHNHQNAAGGGSLDAAAIGSGTLAAARIPSSLDATKLANGLVSNTEFQYLDGVTSPIQTQLDAIGAGITGTASTIDTETLTASRVMVTDGAGKAAVEPNVDLTELSYLDGVTGGIQAQLNGLAVAPGTRQVADHAALVALTTPVAGQFVVSGDTMRGGLFKLVNNTTSTNRGTKILLSASGWSAERQFGADPVEFRWFGPSADGVTDDASLGDDAATVAKASPGKTLRFHNAVFKINDDIDVSGLRVELNGATLLGDGDDRVLEWHGSLGSFTAIDADMVRSQTNCLSALGASLVSGDYALVISTKNFSGNDAGAKEGELHIVDYVDGGDDIVFRYPVHHYYTVANTGRVAKVTMTTGSLIGPGTIKQTSSTGPRGVWFEYAEMPVVENVKFIDCEERCVEFTTCYKPKVDAHAPGETFTAGLGYGVVINGATMFADVTGNWLGVRHAVTHGGLGTAGGVPWGSYVHDLVGSVSPDKTDDGVVDAHGACGSWTLDRAKLYSMMVGHATINSQALYTWIKDTRIIGNGTSATGISIAGANAEMQLLDIDGLESTGITGNLLVIGNSAKLGRLRTRRLKSDATGTYLVNWTGSTVITNWDGLIDCESTAGLYQSAASAISGPTNFYARNCSYKFASAQSSVLGIFIQDTTTKHVYLDGMHQKYNRHLVRAVNALDSIHVSNSSSEGANQSDVVLSAGATYISLVNNNFENTDTGSRFVLVSSSASGTASLVNNRAIGANRTAIRSGTYGKVHSFGNDWNATPEGGTTTLGYSPVLTAIFSTNAAVTATVEMHTIFADTSGAGFTVTLPATPLPGQQMVIKKVSTDSNTLTIGRNSKNIDGAAANLTTSATTLPSYTLQYDGTAWWVVQNQ